MIKKLTKNNYFSILLTFLIIPILASAEPISSSMLELNDSSDTFSAITHAKVLIDPSLKLDLEQVSSDTLKDQFIPNSKPHLNLGRSRSAFWIKFEVVNHSQKKWYLLLDSMLGDELDLYISPIKKPVSNSLTTYATKLENFRRQAWSLDLPKGEKLQVYMRVKNGDSIINVPIQFLTSDRMLSQSNWKYKVYSALYGAMIIIGFCLLFMFFSLREKSYLYLSTYILALILVTHRLDPVFEILNFFNNTSSYFFTLPLFLTGISAILFVREILETRKNAPRIDRAFIALLCISAMLMPIIWSLPAAPVYPIILGLIIQTFIQFSAFHIAYSKNSGPISKYFAWISLNTYLLVVITLFLKTFFNVASDKLPDSLIYNLITLFSVLCLTLLLAHKIRIQNNEMQREKASNETKDEFIAVMNHELRTPMNAIVGLSSLMKLEKLTKPQRVYANQLDNATKHMMQLINNVLDFSKTNQPLFNLEKKPFQLSIALQSVYHLLLQQAQQKDLRLTLENPLDETLVVLGDRARLSQILNNFLTNAIRYTEEGEVSLAVAPLTNDSPNSIKLRFSVKDTGPGIPNDQLEKIFTPFTQLETQNTSSQREGLGLGLPISKNLIEQMGSTLHVNSRINEGSEFYFDLEIPLAAESEIAKRGNAELTSLRLPAGTRILLVDDSELNRFIGGEMIQNLGAEVILANSGKNAMLQLQQDTFDLVLLDISMPQVSGLTVTHWIRQQSQHLHLPVIAMTAHNLDSMRKQCKDAGMNDYIVKPFEYEDLYHTVNLHLSGIRTSSEAYIA